MVLLFDFDFPTCSFKEVISYNIDSKYFAEGLTVVNNQEIY